ncbi:MAG: DUF3761 domain-containing protein [Fibromonadaceae bacterium]|jgi:hypothetical protein|nr:DUF3761 domain-containing protein [Fibromonadaceae bacterium]
MIKIIVLFVTLTATFSFSQKEIYLQDSLGIQPYYSTQIKKTTDYNSYYNCPNGSYKNSQGSTVCRPSANNVGGATAVCRDGTYSYSQNRRGTCSGHGGVARWL